MYHEIIEQGKTCNEHWFLNTLLEIMIIHSDPKMLAWWWKNQTMKWALFVIIFPETKLTSAVSFHQNVLLSLMFSPKHFAELDVFIKRLAELEIFTKHFAELEVFTKTFCWAWNNHHFLFLFCVDSNNWQGYL